MLKFEKFNDFFFKSVDMTMDGMEDFVKKSDLWYENIKDDNISINTKWFKYPNENKFEIKLFTCAHFFNDKIEGLDIEYVNYFNNYLIVNLAFVAEYEYRLVKNISHEYIKKRLLEYKDDIRKCMSAENQLPTYTYCSIFKSPLNEFDLIASENLNILDIYKFKLYLIHWSSFIQKSANQLFNVIKSEV